MKIHSPVKGYTDRTEIGPYVLEFVDGVADYDEDKHGALNDGVKAYLRDQGYGLGSKAAIEPDAAPEPPDPREVGTQKVGTPVRDGAVDPRPGDFLGPTNAGEANPHGSQVVNPEIHASEGVRPVKPGDVHVGDPDAQDAAEKAHTEASTDGTPVADGSVQPAGNGSLEDWQEYARSKGATDADLDGKGRNDLRDTYGS